MFNRYDLHKSVIDVTCLFTLVSSLIAVSPPMGPLFQWPIHSYFLCPCSQLPVWLDLQIPCTYCVPSIVFLFWTNNYYCLVYILYHSTFYDVMNTFREHQWSKKDLKLHKFFSSTLYLCVQANTSGKASICGLLKRSLFWF